MNKNITPKHLDTTRSDNRAAFGRRASAAVMAGLLSLSLSPALAFAEPAGNGGPQGQGGDAPAMQQQSAPSGQQGAPSQQGTPTQWQDSSPAVPQDGMTAPTGAQEVTPSDSKQSGTPAMPQSQQPDANGGQRGDAPSAEQSQQPSSDGSQQNQQPSSNSGQQPGTNGSQQNQRPGTPNGQQPTDGTDDDVRKILSETYGIDTTMPGANACQNGAAPSEAPEIPEGMINVQQVIDSVRDTFRYCLDNQLETLDLSDESLTASLTDFIKASDAKRQEQFSTGKKPEQQSDAPMAQDQNAKQADEAAKPTDDAAKQADDDAKPSDETKPTDDVAKPSSGTNTDRDVQSVKGIFASLRNDDTLLGKIVSFIAHIFGYED